MVYAPSAGAVGVVSSLYAPAFRYQAAFNFSERDNSSTSPTPAPCAAPSGSASSPNATGPSPSNSSVPTTTSSANGPNSYQLSGGEVWALAAVLATLWLVSVVGNLLVLLVVQRSRRTQSTTNHFVVSLAGADLLLSVGVAPFALLQVVWGGWPLGGAACRTLRYLQHLCPGVQAFVLLSIAVDRFYTIVFPLSFKVSREKAKRMIAASWLLDSAFVSPCLFLYGSPSPSDSTHCRFFLAESRAGLAYASLHLLVGCAAPAALVVFFYQRVVRHIWRLGTDGHALRRTTNVVPRTKVKTVKMFLVLNSLFFVTWTPFYVAQLWHPGEAEGPSRQGALLFAAVAWLSLGSAATKPTLYSVYNANFRRGMRETFCMSSMKCYRSNAYTITASSRMAKKNHVGVVDVSTQAKAAATKDSAVYSAFDHEAKEKKLAWPTNSNPSNTFV